MIIGSIDTATSALLKAVPRNMPSALPTWIIRKLIRKK